MHLKRNIEKKQDINASFLRNNKQGTELDDSTFNMWKSELQKELPSFWESMSTFRRR